MVMGESPGEEIPPDEYSVSDCEIYIYEDGTTAELIGLNADEWILTDMLVENVS